MTAISLSAPSERAWSIWCWSTAIGEYKMCLFHWFAFVLIQNVEKTKKIRKCFTELASFLCWCSLNLDSGAQIKMRIMLIISLGWFRIDDTCSLHLSYPYSPLSLSFSHSYRLLFHRLNRIVDSTRDSTHFSFWSLDFQRFLAEFSRLHTCRNLSRFPPFHWSIIEVVDTFMVA